METLWGLQRTEELVNDPAVKMLSALTEKAFTRKRRMGFEDALRFPLDMSHAALPHRLRAVMDELARVVSPARPDRSFPRVPRLKLAANAHLKSRL